MFNAALSSTMCHCYICFSFPPVICTPFSAHFWLFLRFIPAVLLVFLIATEEDYRRAVKTFGYYNFLLQTASVDTTKTGPRMTTPSHTGLLKTIIITLLKPRTGWDEGGTSHPIPPTKIRNPGPGRDVAGARRNELTVTTLHDGADCCCSFKPEEKRLSEYCGLMGEV